MVITIGLILIAISAGVMFSDKVKAFVASAKARVSALIAKFKAPAGN